MRIINLYQETLGIVSDCCKVSKEKQQEEKIGSLESEVKSLKGDLNDIKSLLQELNSSNRNSKTTSKT